MRPPVVSPPPDFPKSPAKAPEMRYTGPYNRKTRPRPRSRLYRYHNSRQEHDLPLHRLTRAKMRANSPNIAASDKQERPHIGEQKSEDRRLQPTLADMSRHKSTLRIKSRRYRSTEARARKPCDPVIIMPIQPRGPAGIASISANPAAGNQPPEKKKKCDIWGLMGTYVPLSRQNERDSVPLGRSAARPPFQ